MDVLSSLLFFLKEQSWIFHIKRMNRQTFAIISNTIRLLFYSVFAPKDLADLNRDLCKPNSLSTSCPVKQTSYSISGWCHSVFRAIAASTHHDWRYCRQKMVSQSWQTWFNLFSTSTIPRGCLKKCQSSSCTVLYCRHHLGPLRYQPVAAQETRCGVYRTMTIRIYHLISLGDRPRRGTQTSSK